MPSTKAFLHLSTFFSLFAMSAFTSVFANNDLDKNNKTEDTFNSTVTLVTGLAKPPYILEDGKSGLQLDIIEQAFACQNTAVAFLNFPLARNVTQFRALSADGVATLPLDYQHPAIYLSEPYVTYENVVVSLTDNHFSIKRFEDLSIMSIAAFQSAKKFLNDDYKNAVDIAVEYREIAEQSQQIEKFYERMFEVMVLDINILKYYLKQHKAALYQQAITYHPLFKPQPYAIGFQSKKLRDEFNNGLKCIQANGDIERIYQQYLN